MGSAQSCADFKFFSRGVLSVNAMRLEKRRHVGSMHGLLEDEVLRFMQNSQPIMSHATPDLTRFAELFLICCAESLVGEKIIVR
jgi:hypothetical protein